MGNCYCSNNPPVACDVWIEELSEVWESSFPRATVQQNGNNSIRLHMHKFAFCAIAPKPYPDWLRLGLGITPEQWYKLVWNVTLESFKCVQRVPGRSDLLSSNQVKFRPQQSQFFAQYIASVTQEWKQRGIRIQYHEAELTNIKRIIQGRLLADMHNWLEFSPLPDNPYLNPADSAAPPTHATLGVPTAAVSRSSSYVSPATTGGVYDVIHVVAATTIPAAAAASPSHTQEQQSQYQPKPTAVAHPSYIKCSSCSFALPVLEGVPRPLFCQQCGLRVQAAAD